MAEPLLIDTPLPTPRGVESESAILSVRELQVCLLTSTSLIAYFFRKLFLYTLNDINITANRFYHKNPRSHA